MLAGVTPMTCRYLQKHSEGSFNNYGYKKAKNEITFHESTSKWRMNSSAKMY